MVKKCRVESCPYYVGTEEDIPMFRFPKDANTANEWKTKIGIDVNLHSFGHVCINHFTAHDIKIKKSLKIAAVPTMNLQGDQQDQNDVLDEEEDRFVSECCEKAMAAKDLKIDNLLAMNAELVQSYEAKIRVMRKQADIKKKRDSFEDDCSYLPAKKVSLRKVDRFYGYKRKIKQLQNRNNYLCRRVKMMKSKETEKSKKTQETDEKIAKITEVIIIQNQS